MEFVGLSGKLHDIDFDNLIKVAESAGLITIINNFDYDVEVAVGLKYFTSVAKEEFLVQLVLPYKDGNKSTYSNFLTEELAEYHIHNTRSAFINFIQRLQQAGIFLKKMHIIFSSEWEDITQSIRYIRCSLKEVEDYFRINNNWYLIFYSLQSRSYFIDFNCPLIFEVHQD